MARRSKERKLRGGREGKTRTDDVDDSMDCVKRVGLEDVRDDVKVE